jgi:replicative DNA helicase
LARHPDQEEILSGEETALRYQGPDRIAHYLEYDREAKEKTSVQFRTGLWQLDKAMDGFETSEVNVISGPPGQGKTLFADSIGQRLMRSEKMRIAWFSFEVPTKKMIEKYVRADDRDEIGLYVPMELKAGNMDWIKAKALEAKLKFDCKAIIIDHLHFVIDMNTKQNMSLNIGGVMRQFKHDVAKELDIIVFIISHQGQLGDNEPSLENIRDSSFIGQEADNVFVVYRTADPIPDKLKKNAEIKGYPRTYDDGFATVKVEKARRAGTFRKKISYQKNGHWLEEIEI